MEICLRRLLCIRQQMCRGRNILNHSQKVNLWGFKGYGCQGDDYVSNFHEACWKLVLVAVSEVRDMKKGRALESKLKKARRLHVVFLTSNLPWPCATGTPQCTSTGRLSNCAISPIMSPKWNNPAVLRACHMYCVWLRWSWKWILHPCKACGILQSNTQGQLFDSQLQKNESLSVTEEWEQSAYVLIFCNHRPSHKEKQTLWTFHERGIRFWDKDVLVHNAAVLGSGEIVRTQDRTSGGDLRKLYSKSVGIQIKSSDLELHCVMFLCGWCSDACLDLVQHVCTATDFKSSCLLWQDGFEECLQASESSLHSQCCKAYARHAKCQANAGVLR